MSKPYGGHISSLALFFFFWLLCVCVLPTLYLTSFYRGGGRGGRVGGKETINVKGWLFVGSIPAISIIFPSSFLPIPSLLPSFLLSLVCDKRNDYDEWKTLPQERERERESGSGKILFLSLSVNTPLIDRQDNQAAHIQPLTLGCSSHKAKGGRGHPTISDKTRLV